MGRVLRAERALATATRELAALRGELLRGAEPKPKRGSKEVLEQLGMWLRTYRQSQNVSRTTLAALAGISITSAKNLERGKHWPTRATLAQLERLPIPAELLERLR